MSTENERGPQQEGDESQERARDARAHEEEDGQPPEATNRVEGD